jgi:archaellum biogenesis ATPase FlaH
MQHKVEQCPDKSINVFLNDLQFKLFPTGPHGSPEWAVRADNGFEPISSPRALEWLNRIWIEEFHNAPHPPGRIPRFPRLPSEEIAELLRATKKANNHGNLIRVAKLCDRVKSLAVHQPAAQLISRWSDIPLASEAPEQKLKWLVKDRIPLRQVTVIAAAKDSYKSMLMLSLAKAVTTNGKFLGHDARQLPVLYLNRDMPKAVFDDYCRTLGLDKSNSRFKILSSLWDTKIQPMQLDDPLLIEFARRYEPLIIIDHLEKFLEGSLDKSKDVGKFMEKAKQLAAKRATVSVLHHVPKNDDTSEGYGSVYAINDVDFGLNITRGGGYRPEESTTIKIQNTKTKMGDYFRLKVRPRLKTKGDFEVIDEATKSKVKWDRDVSRFKKLFPEDDWIEKRNLRSAAMSGGMSRARFMEIFDFCREQEIFRMRNSGKGLKQCKLAR